MAQVKPGPDAPAKSTRIDGMVYDLAPQTPTLRIWDSPRASPSPRFEQFDSLAKQADAAWDGYDEETKRPWDERTDEWITTPGPICLPKRKFTSCDKFDLLHESGFESATPGKEYHRAVWIERILEGIAPSPDLPGEDWQWQQPNYQFSWTDGPRLTYTPSTEREQPELTFSFYVRTIGDPKIHAYMQKSRWRFLLRTRLFDGIEFDLRPWWNPWAAKQSRPGRQLFWSVAEPGDSAYVKAWVYYPVDSIWIDNYPDDPP